MIALAVISAVWGVIAYLEGRGAEKERAKWAPKLEAAQGEIRQLEGDIEGWKIANERCTASIIEARKEADARDQTARTSIAKAKQEVAAKDQRIAELALEAANPPEGATCESAVVAVTEKL